MTLRHQTGDNVEGEAGNSGADREVRAGSDGLDIGVEGGTMIGDEMEFDVFGVGTSCGEDLLPKTRQIDFGRSAVGVMEDRDAVHLQLVHRLDEGSDDIRSDPGAGVAHDMDVANLETKDGQRVDPAVHAGHHGKMAAGDRRQLRVLK